MLLGNRKWLKTGIWWIQEIGWIQEIDHLFGPRSMLLPIFRESSGVSDFRTASWTLGKIKVYGDCSKNFILVSIEITGGASAARHTWMFSRCSSFEIWRGENKRGGSLECANSEISATRAAWWIVGDQVRNFMNRLKNSKFKFWIHNRFKWFKWFKWVQV